MKNIGLILAVLVLINGCGIIPNNRVVEKGIALPRVNAIVMGEVVLYDQIETTNTGGETTLNFINERKDETAQKAIILFQKRFSEKLSEKGMRVIETSNGPFVGTDVNLAFRFDPEDPSEARLIGAQMLVFSPPEAFTELTGTAFISNQKKIILEIDHGERAQVLLRNINVGNTDIVVSRVAEQFADVLCKYLSIRGKNKNFSNVD